MCARKGDYPLHVIVGAFLHDIGHLVGIERHMEKMYNHGLSGHKEGEIIVDMFFVMMCYTKIIFEVKVILCRFAKFIYNRFLVIPGIRNDSWYANT